MGYMEDYEDYIELDTISYSIYEETVNEKDAKTRLINSLNKIQVKAKEKENAIKQSEINSKNCIRKQSRSKKR